MGVMGAGVSGGGVATKLSFLGFFTCLFRAFSSSSDEAQPPGCFRWRSSSWGDCERYSRLAPCARAPKEGARLVPVFFGTCVSLGGGVGGRLSYSMMCRTRGLGRTSLLLLLKIDSEDDEIEEAFRRMTLR